MMTQTEALRTRNHAEPVPELVRLLDQYLADLQAGKQPDRRQLLAEHPDLASQLEECLAGIDFVYQSAQRSPGAPARLGDFRIVREVGRGGMGVVYEAEQVSLKRRVALKVLRAVADAQALQRFHREAETVAGLHHTNIVPIFAIGSEQGVPYYAMQFIEGRSLAQVGDEAVRSGVPVPVRLLADWGLQAAEALEHAHRRGVVHRDVKPSNLILDPDGRLWLADFGLAKRADDVALSVTGALLGTPRYMSPEQAAAGETIDQRTDVYSLGATLYELATGRPIFDAASPHAILTQILHAEPPAPRTLAPHLPHDLETILLKCLAKEPSRRYQTAQELADDLRAFLDGRPIGARRPTWLERAGRWARRNPLAAGLTAALATALVGGFVGMAGLWVVAEDRRVQAEASAETAQQERDLARDRLWRSLLEGARAERLVGQRWRALELLAEAKDLHVTPELRQEAIQAAITPGIRQVCQLGPQDIFHGGESPRVAFSHDAALVAAPARLPAEAGGKEASGVRVWELPSGRQLREAPCVDLPGAFAFSPAAPLLALAGDDQVVRLWDPRTGKELTRFPGRPPVRFSPDGRRLAVRGPDGVEVWETGTGQRVRQFPGTVPAGFISADTLLVRDGSRLHLWKVSSGEKQTSSPDGFTAVWSVEVGPVAADGPIVVLRRGGGRHGLKPGPVALWNAVTGKILAELPEVDQVGYGAALPVNASAELFAFRKPDERFLIRLFDSRTGESRRPLVPPGRAEEPLLFGRFSPDGSLLAAQEGNPNPAVRLWNVDTGEPLACLRDHDNPVWSPDGRYLAAYGPGRFELPGGFAVSGGRNALLVYEVVPPPPVAAVSSPVKGLAFRVDGGQLAAQGRAWEVVEQGYGRRLRSLSSAPREAGTNATFVATGGGLWSFQHTPHLNAPPPKSVRLQQVFPDRREVELAGVAREEAGSVLNLAVSPDGQRLLLEWRRFVPQPDQPRSFRLKSQLELWDLAARKRRGVWKESPRRGDISWGVLRFSPDGRLVATTESGFVFIRNADTGEVLHEAKIETILEQRPGHLHTQVHTVRDAVFTPDGRFLVCGGDEGRLAVIQVATGKVESVWGGHEGTVRAVAVSPDGHTLASGGEDRTVRLWDLATRREQARWEAHEAPVTALTFSPDGRTVASGSSDGTVRLWDLPSIRRELAALGMDW